MKTRCSLTIAVLVALSAFAMGGWRLDEAAGRSLRYQFDGDTSIKEELATLMMLLAARSPVAKAEAIDRLCVAELLTRNPTFQDEVTEKRAAAKVPDHPAAVRLGGGVDKDKAAIMATPTMKKMEAVLNRNGYEIEFVHLENFRKTRTGELEGDLKLALRPGAEHAGGVEPASRPE